MSGLDGDTIRHALAIARKNGFAEVELEVGDDSFSATLRRKPVQITAHEAPSTSESPQEPEVLTVNLTAPCVGYVRETNTAISVGRVVTQGELVVFVEALGIANEVYAPCAGEVIEVLAPAGSPVQYGQPIATLRCE